MKDKGEEFFIEEEIYGEYEKKFGKTDYNLNIKRGIHLGIEKGKSLAREEILKEVLELIAFDFNNVNLILLRDKLKEELKNGK